MTRKRATGKPQRQTQSTDSAQGAPAEQAWQRPTMSRSGSDLRICCHGETAAPPQRQFQFRNLSDDPRLTVRLNGLLKPARGTG